MKVIVLKISFLFFLSFTFQNHFLSQENELVYMIVDQKATFPGGITALNTYFNKTLEYPKSALKKHTEGKVYVRFVIKKNGDVDDLKLLKGIGEGCDEEAIKVVEQMPKWNPAFHKGESVASYVTIPIEFTLHKVPQAEE